MRGCILRLASAHPFYGKLARDLSRKDCIKSCDEVIEELRNLDANRSAITKPPSLSQGSKPWQRALANFAGEPYKASGHSSTKPNVQELLSWPLQGQKVPSLSPTGKRATSSASTAASQGTTPETATSPRSNGSLDQVQNVRAIPLKAIVASPRTNSEPSSSSSSKMVASWQA